MVLKELILTVSTLGQCNGPERTDFEQLILWEGVVVLKELILTLSTLGQCSGPERTDFEQFLCWGCGGLEPTDFHSFNIRRVWQS